LSLKLFNLTWCYADFFVRSFLIYTIGLQESLVVFYTRSACNLFYMQILILIWKLWSKHSHEDFDFDMSVKANRTVVCRVKEVAEKNEATHQSGYIVHTIQPFAFTSLSLVSAACHQLLLVEQDNAIADIVSYDVDVDVEIRQAQAKPLSLLLTYTF